MRGGKYWNKLPLENCSNRGYYRKDANKSKVQQKGYTSCHTTRSMEELLKLIRSSDNPDDVVIHLISFSEQILADRHTQKDVDILLEKSRK